ncbi:aminotransferase [Yoonia sp. 2307UL14-13]|uniref:aminotransferase n=1 Tax=Yoonia sp. 2307UL14-13 TaxID=3126506 RepID=UPI0030B44ED7
MHITPFGVEIWMNEWETKCDLNLAETCVHSLTVAELFEVVGKNSDDLSDILSMHMTYGPIKGSDRLRRAIAALYDRQSPDNVVVTHGTIGANMLVHKALVSAGDKVVSIMPTYQQHDAIPASLGADVHHFYLREEDGFLPDLDHLRHLVGTDTKLIALTNPNNPTGALIDQPMLEQIAKIARAADAWILCDEVYRGIDQTGDGTTASIADIYEKGIGTAGMSKAFSLAGLRLGWVVAPPEMIEAVMIHRDYDTISVGQIDDYLAMVALEHHDKVLARSKDITRGNLATLEAWMNDQPLLSWIKPRSGTTTLLKYDLPMSSRDFCVGLLQETGVMLTPGEVFGMGGYVRIGFGNPESAFSDGLGRLSDFLNRQT